MDTKPLYNTNDIDFEESSRLWRLNKIKSDGGMFYYKCSNQHCNRKALNDPDAKDFFCKWHGGFYSKSYLLTMN